MKRWFIFLLSAYCHSALHASGGSETIADTLFVKEISAKKFEQILPETEVFVGTPVTSTATSGTCMLPGKPCNPPAAGTNLFNPFSGNVHRPINDLEVWGGVGDEPLVWTRYANSRRSSTIVTLDYGDAHNWSSSYMFYAISRGLTQIQIRFPEGYDETFTLDLAQGNIWKSSAGVDKRIIQYGGNYFLQMANGYRYRFIKSSLIEYQLQDFTDNHHNLYTLTYTNNKLSRVTEPAGRYLQIIYAAESGKQVIKSVSTNDGRTIVYNYTNGPSNDLRLTRVDYEDGTKAYYEYVYTVLNSAEARLSHAIDPRYSGPSVNMRYTYQPSLPYDPGWIKEERNGKTNEVMATLSVGTDNDIGSDSRKVCYANGRTQIYNVPVSQAGKAMSYTNALGNGRTFAYANGGFRSRSTDELSRVTTYDSVTVYGGLLKLTHPDGSKESWTRDSLDQVLTHTDGLLRTTAFTRDTGNRISRIDYYDKTYETFTYNKFGQVLNHRNKNGAVEHFEYDARGLKTKFIDALGNTTEYTYDSRDRLQSLKDPRKNTTTFDYFLRGMIKTITHPGGSFIAYDYDTLGNRTIFTDELNHTWITVYDEFRRPKTVTDPLGRITSYAYDLPGSCGCAHSGNNPTRITLPSGKITEIEYDLEWNKIRETVAKGSPEDASTYFRYDKAGNLARIVDPKGKQWQIEFDLRNRKKSSTDPLGNKTEWRYDTVGRISTLLRPDKGVTTYQYDDIARTTTTTDPKGQVTKMAYDSSGNMVKLTDARNNDYHFQYDTINRKRKMIYPGGSFEEFTYDSTSNLKTYRNRAGQVRTYIYDNRNREESSAWNDNITPSISQTYYNNGFIKTITSSVSALSYTYNAVNQLTSETQEVAGMAAKMVKYRYNTDGVQDSITYPGGTGIKFDYTNRYQLSSISVNGASPLVVYKYDVDGNRISKVLDNGTSTDYTYDDAGRMLSINNRKAAASFARLDYGYDSVDRRKFVYRNNDKGDAYSYDAIDQVTSVKYEAINADGIPGSPERTMKFSFDKTGNLMALTDSTNLVVTQTDYATNNLNQYTGVGAGSLAYSTNGNLQIFNGWNYSYDAQNRLTKAEKAGTVVQLFYDPRNRCVRRTVNGISTVLFYNGWSLIEERNENDLLLARYVHGEQMDEVICKTSSTENIYYHHDALGSVVHLTNSTGNIIEKYSYDIYGVVTIKNSSGNVITASSYVNRFMFTGREYIPELGLYDYRNRIYSPVLGRFLQADPASFSAGDVNIYRYIFNNPLNGSDPLGLGEEWHHLLPKAIFTKAFMKTNGISGLNINDQEFGLLLDNAVHGALHDAGWNDEWELWIKRQKGPITPDMIRKQLKYMKTEVFPELISLGKAATASYHNYKRLKILKKLVRGASLLGTAMAIYDWCDNVKNKGFFWGTFSTALDAIPYVGVIKAGYEMYTGEDLIPDLEQPVGLNSPG